MTIQQKIQAIKEKKQAIILAHNYQRPEIQDIADFVGDSLDLSRIAANTEARVIVFCGVHFMAETASILSPDKTILLPDIEAGCPMADMLPVSKLRELKSQYPDAVVVSYVNTHADVKAESDYCCTSANGIRIVSAIPLEKRIIFTPDKYLGSYIIKQTGRDMILTDGFCPTHQTITEEGILQLRRKYPQATVIVHPECSPGVIDAADEALSTNGMCKFVAASGASEFIVGTETGIIHRLKKENPPAAADLPQKQFYPVSLRTVCPNMKLITIEKLLLALEEDRYQIKVNEDIAEKARMAIERMLAVG